MKNAWKAHGNTVDRDNNSRLATRADQVAQLLPQVQPRVVYEFWAEAVDGFVTWANCTAPSHLDIDGWIPCSPLAPCCWIDYNKREYLASTEYLFVILSGFLPAHCRCLLTLSVSLANDNDKTLRVKNLVTDIAPQSTNEPSLPISLSPYLPLFALRLPFVPPLTAHQILISAIGGAQFQLIRLPNADKTFPISPCPSHRPHRAMQSFSGRPFSQGCLSRCVVPETFWYVFIFLVASLRAR